MRYYFFNSKTFTEYSIIGIDVSFQVINFQKIQEFGSNFAIYHRKAIRNLRLENLKKFSKNYLQFISIPVFNMLRNLRVIKELVYEKI